VHGREILREYGFGADEIETLVSEDVLVENRRK
jgi:hypothetical protein